MDYYNRGSLLPLGSGSECGRGRPRSQGSDSAVNREGKTGRDRSPQRSWLWDISLDEIANSELSRVTRVEPRPAVESRPYLQAQPSSPDFEPYLQALISSPSFKYGGWED